MKRRNSKNAPPLQFFSEEKLSEFRHMSPRARLQWLEEANALVNKAARSRKRKAPARPS
jgi:hypothetical protein